HDRVKIRCLLVHEPDATAPLSDKGYVEPGQGQKAWLRSVYTFVLKLEEPFDSVETSYSGKVAAWISVIWSAVELVKAFTAQHLLFPVTRLRDLILPARLIMPKCHRPRRRPVGSDP